MATAGDLMVAPRVARLEAHEPVPATDVVSAARDYVSKGRFALAVSLVKLASMVLERSSVGRMAYTSAVPTFAVTIGGDGAVILMINPWFAIGLMSANLTGDDVRANIAANRPWWDGADAPRNIAAVLYHEMLHVIYAHVKGGMPRDETATLAHELVINHMVKANFGGTLPSQVMYDLDDDTFEPRFNDDGTLVVEETGVDPSKVHADYVKDLKANGKTPLPYADFVATDIVAESELRRMSRPPKSQGNNSCVHGSGNGGADGDQSAPLDQEGVADVAGPALADAMAKALPDDGNRQLRQELLELGERTGDSEHASKVWGDLGLGQLRGEPIVRKEVAVWYQWLRNALQSRLQEGERLTVVQKLTIASPDFPFRWRGDDIVSHGVVAIDTSGSMHQSLLDKIRKLVGTESGLEVDFVNFDANVVPLEWGNAFAGGGGTSFDAVSDYVDELEEYPDFVVVVTDGYAPPITPKHPERWVWLIVGRGSDAGNNWPASHTPLMASHVLSEADLESLGGTS